MNRLLSINFALGLLIGAALASLLLSTASLATRDGLAGACIGFALGAVALVAVITTRNRWTGDDLDD
jgi:hypothetical protein